MPRKAEAINADPAALKAKYIRYMNAPYDAGLPSKLLAYPATTERYLNRPFATAGL